MVKKYLVEVVIGEVKAWLEYPATPEEFRLVSNSSAAFLFKNDWDALANAAMVPTSRVVVATTTYEPFTPS